MMGPAVDKAHLEDEAAATFRAVEPVIIRERGLRCGQVAAPCNLAYAPRLVTLDYAVLEYVVLVSAILQLTGL